MRQLLPKLLNRTAECDDATIDDSNDLAREGLSKSGSSRRNMSDCRANERICLLLDLSA